MMKKLSLFACLLFLGLSVFANDENGHPLAAMSGVYTVNPAAAVSGTNFIRIGQADTAMMTNGISGPVEIQIYNGTYNQANINLGPVAGSDATNTITFTSLSQDSVQTVINALGFVDVSNIIIRKLNLTTVTVDGNVSNYLVTNNQIKFFKWVGGSNVSFVNNYIKPLTDFTNVTNFPPPISFVSKTGAYINNVLVEGNNFRQASYFNQAGIGTTGYSSIISWSKVSRPILRGNRFQNINASNVGYGLIGCCTYVPFQIGSSFQFDNCTDTAFVEKNRFDSISTDRLVHDINSSNQNDATPRLSSIVIRNNFFSVTAQLGMTAYAAGASNIEFYYNNINNRGGNVGPVLTPNMINIKNNIFASSDGSRVLTYGTHPAVADYNDFYTSGPVLAVNTSTTPSPTNYATLAQYQAATGLNPNSKNVNPKYISISDLHVVHPGLLATGTPHPAASPLLKDIDDQNRNALNPCIGADEFQAPSNDVIALQYAGPKKDFTASVPTVLAVKIVNNGSANLNQVNIRWAVNGVEQSPAYAWTGNLAYDSSATINFANYTFEMMKYNSLKIWTDLPNNSADMVPVNDTVRVDSIMPYARGTFTLGGVTPQLPNFAKANEYLIYGGVDGAVDIAIRDGKYTEQPIMKFARGTSIANTITFRGENNNASLDTLSFTSTGTAANYTMRLDSAAYFAFKNLSFQSLSSFSTEIEFVRKARFITFDSCVFTSAATNANYPHVAGTTINSLPQLDSNIVFSNNRFTGGYGGIQLPLRNGIIKGNRFDNFLNGNASFGLLNFTGSFAPLNNYIIIDSNYISNPIVCTLLISGTCYQTGYNSIGGVNISSTSAENDFQITRNRFNVISRNAINISTPGTAAKPIKINNNFITIRSSGVAIATTSGCNYTEIMHNSLADSVNSGSNLVELRGTNNVFKNNVLVKGIPNATTTSTANLLNLTTSVLATLTSTNNAYSINDTAKAIYNGTANMGLGQWKTTGKDANSTVTTPAFINAAADLHIDKNKAGAADLAKKATPIAYIIKDIDDSARSLTAPCIGADEFTLNPVDGGVSVISAPGFPMSPGNNAVIVSVKNYGDANLTSATVNWSVNGAIQTPGSFAGSLASGEISAGINLGNFNFNLPQAYTIKSWTSNVNGGGDINAVNDTTIRIVYPALCGSYTVGGTTPDFTAPKDAMIYASQAGVTCPVVFNIRDGQYNESDTLSSIFGTSAINTVTFQSESLDSSKVTIYLPDYSPVASAANFILRVDGAKYIKFKKLGIKRTVAAGSFHFYFSMINLVNDVSGLEFSNCEITGLNNSTVISYPIAVSNIPSNINILNNNITGGIPINFSGFPGLPLNNINISNNKFRSTIGSAANAQVTLIYTGNVTIDNNYFDSTATANVNMGGVNLQSATGKISISNNKIMKRKGAAGIFMSQVAGLNYADSAVIVANNFITMDSVGTAAALYGTQMGQNVKVLYNNLLNNCYSTASNNSYALYFANNSGTPTFRDTVANNNIIVTGTGYALYQSQSTAGYEVFNNNNIWSAASTKLAQYNGSNYTTIAALATASGSNTATVSMNPGYVNNNDLHITELNLRSAGKPYQSVLTDIDGDIRGTVNSTIGADEIVVAATDAGVFSVVGPVKPFATGNRSVIVSVKNYGNDPLTGAVINWSVNGTLQTPYNFTGNVAFNTTANATIGTVNFVVDSAFSIKAWTTNPNGTTDLNNANDTTIANNIYPALSGTYTLGGVTPDFKGFVRSNNNLKYGGMLGSVTFNVRDGRYNEAMYIDSIGTQNSFSVTWQGESADSSKAVLAYTTALGDDKMAVLQMNNTKNITFKNLGVQVKIPTSNASGTYTSMVYLSKANRNLKFLNNMFVDSTYNNSANTTGSRFFYNTDAAGSSSSYAARSADSAIVIDNGSFRQVNLNTNAAVDLGGSYSTAFNGVVTVDKYLNNLIFSNNKFNLLLLSKAGVNIGYTDSLRMINNKMQGTVTTYGKDLMIVDRNEIYHEGNNTKVFNVNSFTGRAVGKPAIISNNMIKSIMSGTFNGAPTPNAVVTLTGDRINFIHNTMAANDTGYVTGFSLNALLNVTGATDTIRNNILYNMNGGYLVYNGTVTGMVSNNNDYVYSNHFATSANNLAAWRTLTSQDATSVENIQPYFRGPRDLHASNIALKAALPVSPANLYAATDIDGQARTTPVCYGADEFTRPLNDMIVLDATPRKIFPEGNNNFGIRVYNNGLNPITSFDVTASVANYPDNVGPTVTAGTINYTYNGLIAPGAEAIIPIGQMNVPVFKNTLKINTTNLNGANLDEVAYDDSLQYDNYFAGLNGIYTFRDNGNSNPATFRNFDEVTQQLKYGGVYGPSQLNLLPGIYNSNVFYADSIPNRGALSPLIIQSQNGDSSTTGFAVNANYAMVIYRANHVTLRNLYFGQTIADANNSLILGYNSQDMSVQNCYFKRLGSTGNLGTPANVLLTIIGQYSGQPAYLDSNYTVTNNRFEGGYAGIYTIGAGTPANANFRLTKNTFINQGGYGLAMVNLKNPLVDSNSISTNTTDNTYIGISSESNFGKMQYTKNRIYISTDGTGIKTLESYSPAYALTDTLLIANNFITTGATSANSINMNLLVSHKKQTSIYHNSMLNRSTSTAAIGFKTTCNNNFGGRFEVINNIIYLKTAGIPVNVSRDGNVTYVQHNDLLYTPGSVYGTVNNTNYATLPILSASTGIEFNSVSGDPLFISDQDLHVDGSIVNNAGSFDGYSVINTDIDNEARSSSTPDIGADEFKLPNFGAVQIETPMSSCSHSSAETVKAWIKNFGTAARTNVPVAYRINLGAVIRDTVRTAINPGDSVLFTFLQPANLATAQDYYFDVWTDYRGDSLPSNDTLKQFLVATTPSNNVLPYYTGFEGTNAGWYTGGQNSSFRWGVIYSGVIDSSANGLNAWKTNLTGPHNNNEKSYLYSPCFNLSAVATDPTLNFNLAYQLENATDKAWVEYSADAGATWTKLGAAGDGLGWYNDAGGYWTGNNHYWHNAKHMLPISGLPDKTSIRVRFVVQTNGSVVQDGLAIDDISIYTGVNPPVANGTYSGLIAVSSGSGSFLRVSTPSGDEVAELNDHGQVLGNITVDVTQNAGLAPTTYNGQTYLGRSFVIHTQNVPTAPVTVRLFITQAEFDAWKAADPNLDQVRSVEIYKYSGANEDASLANNSGGTGLTIASANVTKIPYLDGYFLQFDVSNFSEFWVTHRGLGVVAVQFVNVKARLQSNGSAAVSWTVATETNVSHYEVMHSTNATTWTSIGSVTANGQQTTNNYSFTDNNVKDGINYYQIKQVDNAGHIVLSNIVSVTKGNVPEITIYPSPFTNSFTVNQPVTRNPQPATLTLYTSDGKVVLTRKLTAGVNNIDGSSLARGVYLYRIAGDDGVVLMTGKMVKE